MDVLFEIQQVTVCRLCSYGFSKIANMITFICFYLTIINNHVNSMDCNSLLLYFAHVESYILNQDRLDYKENKYWNGKNTK